VIVALLAFEAIVLFASWLAARREKRAAQTLRPDRPAAHALRKIPVENAVEHRERGLLYAHPR